VALKPDKAELIKLIQNEIELGFTFLDTYDLSSSSGHDEHASQSFRNAQTAWETATRLLDRLTEEESISFRPGLRDLGSAIHARTSQANRAT
jgi:hypothetical protein